jgi:signal transduction histidine kinase/ActR/RegA family two-component response regulator
MRDAWAWLGDAPGEVGQLIRQVDWGATAVGPVEGWSSGLKSLVTTMLHARHPMFLWWGPELVQFYNDAYVPSFGVGRHPAALGQRGKECWAEIWPIIGPEIAGVIETGVATFHDDALVPIFRNGRMEEVYWTYGYSPVIDDGVVNGVLVVVTETTSRVVALRRLRTERTLAEFIEGVAHRGDLGRQAVAALDRAREDSPWVVVSRTERRGPARVVASSPDLPLAKALEVVARAHEELHRVGRQQQPLLIDLSSIADLPASPWPEPCTQAVVFALADGDGGIAEEQLVIGLTPRLPYDPSFVSHLNGVFRQFAAVAKRIDLQAARVAAEGVRDQLLLQAPVAAALLVGPRWRYELANRAYVELVGREVAGRTWHECFPELLGTPVEAILEGVYRNRKTFFASEQLVPLVRAHDGVTEERYFDFNMIPIDLHAGTGDAMMVIAVEMTAQVQARHEIERRALERERLVGQLEAASRAKDEFLAMMGHELRNPLAPIVTALRLMSEKSGEDTRREQAVIGRHVDHLVRLVDDLLDVSRIVSGKVELRRTTSDVSALVEHAVEIVHSLFETRQHELVVEVQPELWWSGDATRLEQILANLLTNAARYTEPGGRVALSVRSDAGDLVVSVTDSGKGIDAGLIQHLFEPFVQGQRAVDRREGGLGLGLAVVKGLVELHGGSVAARSEGVGRGSEFVVRLPGLTASPERAVPASRSFEKSAPIGGARVLVVDDNVDAADMLAVFLTAPGCDVRVAHDGPEALASIEGFEPTVAIIDIGLPLMDGYELVQRMREQMRGRCRYIALTGYGQREDIERALAAGFERLLVKPVDLRVLRELLAGESASKGASGQDTRSRQGR